VRYVLQECKEAETKIKLQIVPETKVDLSDKASTATFAAITLPDRVTEVDLMLPDIDLTSLVNPAALSQVPNLINVQDITIDGMGWHSEQTPATVETPQVPPPSGSILRPISPTHLPSPGGADADIPSPREEPSDTHDVAINLTGFSPFTDVTRAPFGDDRPLSPGGQDLPQTPVQRSDDEERQPVDDRKQKDKKRGTKRPRGLIVDKETEISGSNFKKLLTNRRYCSYS